MIAKIKMELKNHKLSLLIRLLVTIAAVLTVGILFAIVIYIFCYSYPFWNDMGIIGAKIQKKVKTER